MNKIKYYAISIVRSVLIFLDYMVFAFEKAVKSMKKDKQHYRTWTNNQSKHVFD